MKEFKGVVVAMVTPFKEDGSVNYEQEEKLVRHFIKQGVNGILVSGGTGEYSTLSIEERKKVIACATEIIKDTEVFSIAGISCNATKDTVELAKYSGEVGADYVLALPPYAIPVSKTGMVDYFKEIKNSTNARLILYHFPGETNVELSAEEIVEMGREGIFDAVKDTASMEHTMELIVANGHKKNLKISNGFDSLVLASLASGADAIITAGANMVPNQFVKIYKLIKENNVAAAAAIYEEIMPLLNLQEKDGNTEVAICKYCLKLQGIDVGIPRKPVTDISNEAKEAVKKRFSEINY